MGSVECDEYVSLFIYGAASLRYVPGYIKGVNDDGNPATKCASHFRAWFSEGDSRFTGTDGAIYDVETYQMTSSPAANTRPGEEPTGNRAYTAKFFSGSTGFNITSSGAYLKGWTIKFVNEPTEKDLRTALGLRQARYEHEITTRIALRQYDAALFWLGRNGDKVSWDYLAEVRKLLPDNGSERDLVTGANPWYRSAIALLAKNGGGRFYDFWMEILRGHQYLDHGVFTTGDNFMTAAYVIGCSGNKKYQAELKSLLDEIKKISYRSPVTGRAAMIAYVSALRLLTGEAPAGSSAHEQSTWVTCPYEPQKYKTDFWVGLNPVY